MPVFFKCSQFFNKFYCFTLREQEPSRFQIRLYEKIIMKKILFSALVMATSYISFGQVYDGMVEYNKKDQPAVMSDYKFPEETVEKALKEKLEKLGLKVKSSKGFLVAGNSIISSIAPGPMDYAFKVDRKSKKEKDITTVSMVMTSGDVSNTAANSSNAKTFLSDLTPAVDAVNTNNMVNDQYTALTKAQKKYKGLQDDQTSLEKKIRNLQDDLTANAKDQADQLKEVQRQQEILDTWKAKKTN